MNKNELIVCILNNGFSDVAMDAARKCGAKGGTVLHGRGTASKEAEMLFNITVDPEKEIILILANSKIKESLLQALYETVGTNTPAQGIAFSLPVDKTVGIGE